MRIKALILFCFFISVLCLHAQSPKNLQENICDFYTKNDSTPFFVFEREELDTFLKINRNIPFGGYSQGINYYCWMSFKVNRDRKIVDLKSLFQELIPPRGKQFKDAIGENNLGKKYHEEAIRLVKLTEPLWYSDSTREKARLFIKVQLNSPYHETVRVEGKLVAASGNIDTVFSKNNLYNLGVRKFATKKTLLAQVYFEQTVAYSPKDVDAYYNLGSCYHKLKKTQKACACWKKCIELGDAGVVDQIEKYCKE